MTLRRHRRPPSVLAAYDGVICDLDGVVYRGSAPVPAAVPALNRAVRDGRRIVFATNNASRESTVVGKHLLALGFGEAGWSVVTSAQAAADHLRTRLAQGTPVVAVGGPGVAAALAAVGLTPVTVGSSEATGAGALVQGLGTEVSWSELAGASLLIREGLPWIVTNTDRVLPGASGPLPGNGVLVDVVREASGKEPDVVVGKPGPTLFDLSRKVLESPRERTLVCGDRLDTDIAGARAAGLDSLLVLSGITSLCDVALAPPETRPTYVAADLGGLTAPAVRPSASRSRVCLLSPEGLPEPPAAADAHQRLAMTVGLAWWVLDAGGKLCRDPQPWYDLQLRLGLDDVTRGPAESTAG